MGPIATLLYYLLSALQLILFLYMILSWVELARRVSRSVPYIPPGNPIVRFIEDVSNTILRPIRRVMEPYQRGYPIDFSFFVAVILIGLIQTVIIARLPF